MKRLLSRLIVKDSLFFPNARTIVRNHIRAALLILAILVVSCQANEESSPTSQPTQIPQVPTPAVTPSLADIEAVTSVSQVPPTLSAIPTETTIAAPTVTNTPPPSATPTPPELAAESINLEPIASGLRAPTFLTHAFDERLFVTEQAGTIRIIDAGILLGTPFLDITNRVGSAGFEQGLLSVAFSPANAEDDRFYVNYTDLNGATVISRFLVHSDDPNQADANSEEILLRIPQPFANHNGGQLQFGPDGMLYVGMGDGGSAADPQNNGQNPSNLLGTILRIDVTSENGYEIPSDNPFIDEPSIPGEIWAYGLRNPWRFSFDRQTGDLYLSDVGQSLVEEVNFVAFPSSGGQNFGWNIMEGASCFQSEFCDIEGLILPIAQYSHQEGGCSITGGYVYRGQRYQDLSGNFFYGDYCSGFVWSLIRIDGEWVTHLVAQSGLKISSFGEGANGELYITDHLGGTVYLIQP